MAEQTFRSPNFFEREIDESARNQNQQIGTPAGVIGTSLKGPAFLPVTVTNFGDFITKFGNLDHRKLAPYAVNEFLKHRDALTFMRVLGAGANDTVEDIAVTQMSGTVKNAGFIVSGSLIPPSEPGGGRHTGGIQFLVSSQLPTGNEAFGYPIFTNNNSFWEEGQPAKLVRGMIIPASNVRFMIFDKDTDLKTNLNLINNPLTDEIVTYDTSSNNHKFKFVISSSSPSFGNDDGISGVRIYSASLNPSEDDYFAKLLNRDPEKFHEYGHVLYADFSVDSELAGVQHVGLLSGSNPQTFGRFDTRYKSPKTTWFISQPFGKTEYDLFHFESLDDGEYSNKLYKISISNIRSSLDDSNPYGTFTVLIRSYDDTDTNQNVLETFPNCSLNPDDDNYIARVIGDKKVYFNFDAESSLERRFVIEGKYENRSNIVRVIVHEDVRNKIIPIKSLPFGFRGIELLKTHDWLLSGVNIDKVINPILPPLPFRFKITRGTVKKENVSYIGEPGPDEITVNNLFWGVKYERNNNPSNSNLTSEKNNLIEAYSKFLGISKLGVLHTGSSADEFNNNKFSLANVALEESSVDDLTLMTSEHMKKASYIRNAVLDNTDYSLIDNTGGNTKSRITFGTLVSLPSPVQFNKFTQYMKFTNMMYGGFDGVNILEKNERRMNDKSTSFDSGGGSETLGPMSNSVSSYLTAANIMLNPMMSSINVITVPGIKEPYITDQIAAKTKNYGLAIYLMDIPSYDDNNTRLYDDSAKKPDVEKTIANFEARTIDNNYVAAYFPDVVINDDVNTRRVKVPASISALAALGLNDRVAYPWFAPAGFNRAALDFVKNVNVRLSVDDRDKLYDARINPIATFPRQGYVIFGQKTLQIKKSALDRVNVRRMLLEIKRVIVQAASRLVFEQNTQELRNRFIDEAGTYIALVQSQQGIEDFKIIMDDSNNTQEDKDLNRLNGRVIVVPTRAVEFISIDFVITNSGVSFTA